MSRRVSAILSRDRVGGITLTYRFEGHEVELYFNHGGEVSDLYSHLTVHQIRRLESAWTEESVWIYIPVDVAEIYLPVEFYLA